FLRGLNCPLLRRCDQQNRRAIVSCRALLDYRIVEERSVTHKGGCMRTVVNAAYERPPSEEGGVSPGDDPLTELLELIEPRDPLGAESSSAPASVPATAHAQSDEPARVSAPLGERALPFRPTRGSELRRRPERSYPYGAPLAQGAFARSPR